VNRGRRSTATRTLWSLAVLAMLNEHSMHPYEMQRVMHQRHTDELLALKRGSLYHAINQLQRDGLIEPIQTSREGKRPERTVYQITADGEEELQLWMRELLSTPISEGSTFTAALAFIRHVPPEEAVVQLEQRVHNLEAGIAIVQAIEQAVSGFVGRASVLELEYQRALARAELDWLRTLLDDLRSNRLTWNLEEIKSTIARSNINIDNLEAERA
jgi:DNA-binding PadR family transcriptional regulator